MFENVLSKDREDKKNNIKMDLIEICCKVPKWMEPARDCGFGISGAEDSVSVSRVRRS
jgi:hypothetical protein